MGLLHRTGPLTRGYHKAPFWAHFFSVYMLSLYLDPGIYRILYADNRQIYAQCHLNELDLLIEKMRNNTDRRPSWAAANNLRLNVGKTKAMVCGSFYYINNLPAVASDILIGDTRIKKE